MSGRESLSPPVQACSLFGGYTSPFRHTMCCLVPWGYDVKLLSADLSNRWSDMLECLLTCSVNWKDVYMVISHTLTHMISHTLI